MDNLKLEIEKIVMLSLRDALEDVGNCNVVTSDTKIYGSGSPLDSMAVVSLIVDIEESMTDYFGVHLSISDERAMSQSKSPFRDVANMVEYLFILLSEIKKSD